jgi:uncharacterized protein with GYD domain
MPSYITLVKWTEQGIKNVKDSPARLAAAGKTIEAMGGRFVGGYYTMGEYDLVVISEGPTDEAATAASLAIAGAGSTRTTTLRAFTAAEFTEIVKKLP